METFKFLWFANKFGKDNQGKYVKNLETFWRDFGKYFSNMNTTMLVLKGEEQQGKPSENCIVGNTYKLSLETDTYMEK